MDRSRVLAAARAIIDQGGWCVLEACVDVPAQIWEVQVVVFGRAADTVADAVAEQVLEEPGLDLRLTGCDRCTLAPDPRLGAYLCYVSGVPLLADVWAG